MNRKSMRMKLCAVENGMFSEVCRRSGIVFCTDLIVKECHVTNILHAIKLMILFINFNVIR